MDPMQLHLTLCFIGAVDGALFHDISQALGEVVFKPFSMQLDGLGFFPPRGKPRVLWVGVQKNEELQRLHQKIYNRLTRIGVELEKRKFSAHITIARLRNTPAGKVARYLEANSFFCSEPFMVENFSLYSSVLRQQGAVHSVEQEYRLVG